jgi:hypothetical protein
MSLFEEVKTMKNLSRKTRSDKFPLTLHPTGQYCKKIRGKIYYFGSDKKLALQTYLDQATFLHGHTIGLQESNNGSMALKQLIDMYLKYQHSRLVANNLTVRHYSDQLSSLNKFGIFLGQDSKIRNISTINLQNYKQYLQKHYGSVCRMNLNISITKAMFHWARKNDILKNIPNIDAVSRGKIIHQDKFLFDLGQIHKLIVTIHRNFHKKIILLK